MLPNLPVIPPRIEFFNELCTEYGELSDEQHPDYSSFSATISRLFFPAALNDALVTYPTADNKLDAMFNLYKEYFAVPRQLSCCIPFWGRFELIIEPIAAQLSLLEKIRPLSLNEKALCATSLFCSESAAVFELVQLVIQLEAWDKLGLLFSEKELDSKLALVRLMDNLGLSLAEKSALISPVLKHEHAASLLLILEAVHTLNTKEENKINVNFSQVLSAPQERIERLLYLLRSKTEMSQARFERILSEGTPTIRVPKLNLPTLKYCSIFESFRERGDRSYSQETKSDSEDNSAEDCFARSIRTNSSGEESLTRENSLVFR